MLELYDEVEKAMDQLQVINAVNELKGDQDLVSLLINKLHVSYQEEWDLYVVERKSEIVPIWDKFWDFLNLRNERAIQSKMQNMSVKGESSKEKGTEADKPKPQSRQQSRRGSTTPMVQSNLTLTQITTRDELNKYSAEVRKNNGPCPCCKKHHTFD